MSSAVPSKPFPDSPVPESPESRRAAAYPATVASTTFYPVVYRSSLSNSYSRFSSFLCRLLSAVVVASLIVAVVSLLMYLCLRPRIPDFRVHSITISNLNTSPPTQFGANFDVTLEFANPNRKLTVLVKEINAIVRYGQSEDRRPTLATVRLAPFSIGTESGTSVRVVFSVVNEYTDSGVVKGIRDEQARGQINFEVGVSAVIKFKIGIMGSRVRSWDVGCYPVPVSFPPNNNGTGTLLGTMAWCGI